MRGVGVLTWAGGALAVVVGLLLAWQAPPPPGADALELEDAVDALCLVVLSAVGLPLLREPRRRALGTALCTIAAVLGTALLLDGVGRVVHAEGGEVVGRALLVTGGALLPGVVVLVLVVLPVLAPTGEPVGRRTGLVARAAVAGAGLLVLTEVLRSGPVDEDAAALGMNPMGIEFLSPVLDAAALLGVALLLGGVLAGLVSLLGRVVRGTPEVRRRTAWLLGGLLLVVSALAVDSTLQSRWGSSYGVLAALVALLGLAACTARALRPPAVQEHAPVSG